MKNSIPTDTRTLIDELDEMFPPRCIAKGEAPEDAHRYAGQRDLVEYLRQWQKWTDEKSQKERRRVQSP